MQDSSSSASSSLQNNTTASRLSPRASQIGRVIYWILFVAVILYTIQLIPHETSFVLSQSAKVDPSNLVPLYVIFMFFGYHSVRIVYLVASLIIFRNKSDNFMHLFAALFLVTFSVSANIFLTYLPDFTDYARQHYLELGFIVFNSLGWFLFFLFLYIFPTGRIEPRWSAIGMVIAFVFSLLWVFPSDSPIHPNNWTSVPLLFFVMLLVFGLPVVTQVYRYRKLYSPIERQQSKWVIWAILALLSIFIVVFGLWFGLFPDAYSTGNIAYDIISQVIGLGLMLVPVSLVLAMLRFRIWDVDLVINRTLVYGAFIFTILGLFFLILFATQIILGQSQVLVTLVISLLCSALSFNFVRNRVQSFVDHNIYRLRFDLNQLEKAHEPIKNAGALTGKQFGRYQMMDLLGRGGMGEVYKAKDGEKLLAIKTLHLEKASEPEMLNRFQREGQAGIHLKHPNIVPVYEMAVHDGTSYMVMAYLEGEDLGDYLRANKKLDAQSIIEIACEIADALEFAHSQGLVHRDIKPSNVMLLPSADKETFRAILTDFGIAKMKDANTITGTGMIGTIDYMAPEQIMNSKTVDHRADIYALGVMLYEMAVGERPFKGGVAQVLFAHMQQPAPDPRESDETIPRGLAKTILKALEKQPEDRFQSVAELSAALQA
jgi:tRNA A-37 threonylcarbamoyl transferase component Bud32